MVSPLTWTLQELSRPEPIVNPRESSVYSGCVGRVENRSGPVNDAGPEIAYCGTGEKRQPGPAKMTAA
jgi:hypothetical protein